MKQFLLMLDEKFNKKNFSIKLFQLKILFDFKENKKNMAPTGFS
jgi:hypothetical protein